MSKILVTGGTGFLGTYILMTLAGTNHTIAATKTERREIPNCLNRAKISFIQCNLACKDDINKLSEFQPDIVIHTAAITNKIRAERDEDFARALNVDTPLNLSKIFPESLVVVSSTDLVGAARALNDPLTDECDLLHGWENNAYAKQKFEMEQQIAANRKENTHRNTIVVRWPLLYGMPHGERDGLPWPIQSIDDARNHTFSPERIPKRTWQRGLYVQDAAEFIRLVVERWQSQESNFVDFVRNDESRGVLFPLGPVCTYRQLIAQSIQAWLHSNSKREFNELFQGKDALLREYNDEILEVKNYHNPDSTTPISPTGRGAAQNPQTERLFSNFKPRSVEDGIRDLVPIYSTLRANGVSHQIPIRQEIQLTP